MSGRTFHEALSGIADKMIDGVSISIGCPLLTPDIAFIFGAYGDLHVNPAKRVVSVGWTAWSAELAPWPVRARYEATDWPMGAMCAAVMVSSEAAKLAGLGLVELTGHVGHYRELFAPTSAVRLSLAPEQTPCCTQLAAIDLISAGAVSNGFLYALLRLPGVNGNLRTYDRDLSDHSNRNRNMLLLPEFVGHPKVELFKRFEGSIKVEPIDRHFAKSDLGALSDRVAIGVDDIPTRWLIAKGQSTWMGVGATSHFNSMASAHYQHGACAACLHPRDEEQDGTTPTIAFVSFLAGLMMAADLLVEAGQPRISQASRHRYVNALQLGNPWDGPVMPRTDCPAGCDASKAKAA